MLKFFRRIRLKLLSEGHLKRYLVYAIGEILLVVIGILIALQINNWNEWRKDRMKEKIVLENLVENMELNIERIEKQLELKRQYDQSGQLIFEAIKDMNLDIDSIGFHFHRALMNNVRLVLSRSGYEAFKNIGFYIVRNEPLRKEIVNLYENTYTDLGIEQVWGQTVEPDNDKYIMEHFFMYEGGSWLPKNFNEVASSNYFYGLINVAERQRFYYGGLYEETLQDTKRVLQLIIKELK